MYGYVYETTCLVNGKKYIGQHKSETFDEKYYGSGVAFLNALNKYGKENFKVKVLEECQSLEELDAAESRHIIESQACERDDYYNLTRCAHQPQLDANTRKRMSESAKARCNDAFKERMSELHSGKTLSEEHRKTISTMCKERVWSDEVKAKMSESAKKAWANGREFVGHEMTPELKQFFSELGTTVHKGTRWINNGTINKQVKPEVAEQYVAEGWKYGRLPDTNKYVWVKKNESCKRILESELNTYLQQGWTRGKIYTKPQKVGI